MIEIPGTSDSIVLSISLNKGTIPVATSSFLKIIEEIILDAETDIYLLGKTRRLSSVSDWHDLSLVAFRRLSPKLQLWMKTFHEVYDYYSTNRKAFTMIEPRPAMIEATAVHHLNTIVKYFRHEDICSTISSFESTYNPQLLQKIRSKVHSIPSWNSSSSSHSHHHKSKSHGSHYDTSRCVHTFSESMLTSTDKSIHQHISPIEMHCHIDKSIENDEFHPCLTVSVPVSWRKNINREIHSSLDKFAGSSFDDLKKEPMRLMWKGVLRFRNTPSKNTTRPFCWENS
jgi:hypothetical protein